MCTADAAPLAGGGGLVTPPHVNVQTHLVHAGEWLYLKRHPYEDREDAIVILCADGEQVASVADDDLWKYAGVQETTAKFVRAGQLIPRGPHRLTVSNRLLGLITRCARIGRHHLWPVHRPTERQTRVWIYLTLNSPPPWLQMDVLMF